MSFSPWVWERDTAETSYCALGRSPFYGQDVNSSSLGWAMSAASSRAFRLHGEIPMLLPLIDMCNHSFNPNARIVQEGSVNSLDMSVKVSILWCSCTPKFSIHTLLNILFQNQAIFFLFLISTFQMGMVLLDYSYYYENICLSQNFYFDLYLSFDTLIPYISVHNCNIHHPCISRVLPYSFSYTISYVGMHLLAMQHLNQLITLL